MKFKALSPLVALTCLSGLALAFGCSDPPAAETPGPGSAGSGTAGTAPGASGSTTTAGQSMGGSTAGSAGAGTSGGGGATTAGAGGATAGAGGGGGGGEAAPVIPGFVNVINENFDAAINLDTDPVWTWSDGGLDEGQVRFTKEAITFADGKMKITVSKPASPTPESPSFAENTGGMNLKSFPLQSGEFRTKHNNYRYGRYEARMKAPMPVPGMADQGNFINTLFIFRTPKIEDWREIDIEVIGGGSGQLMTNLVHGNGVSRYDQTQNKAVQTPMLPVPQGFNTMNDFHTYAFEWTAQGIKWFVDGMQVRQEMAGGTPPIPDKPAKIMMSMWVFNSSYAFGGLDGEANMYPFTAEYEYFRFYKQENETFPCEPTPGCIAAEDYNKSKNNPTEMGTKGD